MTGRAVVLRGDAASLPLPAASVDLIVTSPPYFGLRSYTDGGEHYDGQIGSEATPRAYLEALLACTREWVRVLRPEGSLFVNLGDKYSGAQQQTHGQQSGEASSDYWRRADPKRTGIPNKSLMGLPWRYALACTDQLHLILRAEIIWDKPNGLPESVQDRVRRSHEQVFHFTRQPRYYSAVDEIREEHSEPQRRGVLTWDQRRGRLDQAARYSDQNGHGGTAGMAQSPLGKLPGSVWSIPSAPLTVPEHLGIDHFAAYPPELVRRIILGWSPPGICTACGQGRRPVAVTVALDMSRPQARRAQQLADRAGLTEAHFAALLSVGISDTGRGAATQSGTGKNTPEVYALAGEARTALGGYAREYLLRRPARFAYVCACTPFRWEEIAREYDEDGAPARWKVYRFDRWTAPPTRPAIILDPFGGTGTTALVAAAYGRTGITIDRSADYSRLARWRVHDPAERARAMHLPKPPPVPDGQGSLFDPAEAAL